MADDEKDPSRGGAPPGMVVSKNGALYVALAILGIIVLAVAVGLLTSSG